MRDYANRPPEQRYSCALAAHSSLLLASSPERAAIKALADVRGPETCQAERDFATGMLYITELQDLDPIDQYRRIVHSDLVYVSLTVADALPVLSSTDVDTLLNEIDPGDTGARYHLLALLARNPPALNEKAWKWAQQAALDVPVTIEGNSLDDEGERDMRPLAFRLLACVDAIRFGRALNAQGWSWKPGANTWINHYGSLAFVGSLPVAAAYRTLLGRSHLGNSCQWRRSATL